MIVVHGVGPVYWGMEYDSEGSWLSRAWLVQDLPPYRRSVWGFRVRVGRRALHLGLCRKATDPHRRLHGIPPTEIGRWGKRAEEEEAPADPTTDEDGPTLDGGALGRPGDGTVGGDQPVRRMPSCSGREADAPGDGGTGA